MNYQTRAALLVLDGISNARWSYVHKYYVKDHMWVALCDDHKMMYAPEFKYSQGACPACWEVERYLP